MEPFVSNRLTDNSGSFLIKVMDEKAFQHSLTPKRHPYGTLGSKESSTETSGLGNPNSSQVAHLLQDHRLLPWKANHHVQLHLTSLFELLTWSTHQDGLSLNFPPKLSTSLCCVSSWSAQSWGTLLPLDPGLPVLCQTPSRRQGTTDPGEPWEQRSPGEVICNSECSGQLPRLCSGFRCSLGSSHYITKRSTTKH